MSIPTQKFATGGFIHTGWPGTAAITRTPTPTFTVTADFIRGAEATGASNEYVRETIGAEILRQYDEHLAAASKPPKVVMRGGGPVTLSRTDGSET